MITKKSIVSALTGCIFSLNISTAGAWTLCSGVPLDRHLYWASWDTGHNEGAECGLGVLRSVTGLPLPTFTFGAAGEIFKRDTMMSLAVQAYRMGATNEAVNVAICSQVHNPGVHQCLGANRDEVANWLATRP